MQTITITNKEEIKICDMLKLKAFDSSYFNIETSIGKVLIYGSNLSMDNINTSSNEIIIKGTIYNIILNNSKEKKESFMKRLFK